MSTGSADEDMYWVVRDADGNTLIEGSYCGRCWLGVAPDGDTSCYSGASPSPYTWGDGYLYSSDLTPTPNDLYGSKAKTTLMKTLLPATTGSSTTCLQTLSLIHI